jgi:hypothetical protein
MFTCEIGPMRVDAERERLYQRYRETVRGERSPCLEDFLHGDSERDVFDTWEVCVRDEGRIVAFSWFDRGQCTIQSLLGVYDPDHRGHSLGYYTMLKEVEFGIDQGMTHFYPGYVLPGEPAMDYKLRVGEVEFLENRSRLWLPWTELTNYEMPVERLATALVAAEEALEAVGLTGQTRQYPMFEAPAWHAHLRGCLDQPLVLDVAPENWVPRPLVVAYDPERSCYRLLRCIRARALTVQVEGEDPRPVDLWVVDAWLATCPDAASLAREVLRWHG